MSHTTILRDALQLAFDALCDAEMTTANSYDAQLSEIRAALAAADADQAPDDCRRCRSYATLVKAKEGQIAHLQAELAKHSEAVNTLASEREANSILTAELAARPAPVGAVQAPEKLQPCQQGQCKYPACTCVSGGVCLPPAAAPAAPIVEVAELPSSRWKAGDFESWATVYTEGEVRNILAKQRAEHAKPEHPREMTQQERHDDGVAKLMASGDRFKPGSAPSRPAAGSESNQSLSHGAEHFDQHLRASPAPGSSEQAKLTEGSEREQFEEWLADSGYPSDDEDLARDSDDYYLDSDYRYMWVAWKGKGCKLRTLVTRATSLHRMLMAATPEPTPEQRAAFEALIAGFDAPAAPIAEVTANWGASSTLTPEYEAEQQHKNEKARAMLGAIEREGAAGQADKPSHEQAMRGYEVACKFGVLEARAFKLVDEMFAALGQQAAAVDGERYRWLRNSARSVDWSHTWAKNAFSTFCRNSREKMDADIDAAIASANQKGE